MARLLAAGFLAAASFASAHPVEKVIGLLKDLSHTAVEDGKKEEVSYTTFAHWCTNSKKDLSKTIAEEKNNLETLTNEIDSHTKNIETLTAGIEQLTADLLKLDQEAGAAKDVRDAGAALYNEEKAALEDTIQAIKDATDILKSTLSSTDTGLLQARKYVRTLLAFVGYRASAEQRSLLQAFAEPRPVLKAAGEQTKHEKGYAFKSGSVIELLKGLSLKFQDELVATNTAETNAINAYALAKEARDNLIKAKQEGKAVKEDAKATAEGDLVAAQAAHASTSADLAADSDTLAQTETSCTQKMMEWEERSKTRSLEIEAIETAIMILAKVTGVRTEAPSNPVPPPSPVALLQMNGPLSKSEQAVRILRQEARLVHSKALERLADDVTERVKHGDGPFNQVINSIQKMIHQLMNEQTEEDDHKNWCDQELSKTNTSIVDKASKAAELTAKIDDAEARAVNLREEAMAADEAAAQILAHMQEATEIRETGKQENKLALKDSQEAQTALANAVAVLKDFYKSSGGMTKESWEFIQAPVELPANPSTWDSGYTSVADPASQPGGIVTVLEKISSEFAEMEAQTNAQEESDQTAYEQDMKDCKIEQARREEESKQKKAEEGRTLEKKREMEATRKSVQGELDATEQYLRDLQPACVEGSSTYEDRKAARAKEVEAMHQAQDLLQKAFEEKQEATPAPPASFNLRKRGATQAALRADLMDHLTRLAPQAVLRAELNEELHKLAMKAMLN